MKLNSKNKILVISSILFLIIAYKLSISKTYFYYSENRKIIEKLTDFENEKKQLSYLYSKNKTLDAILKNNKTSDSVTNYQNYLLKTVSELCSSNNVKIIQFEEPEIVNTESGEISHYKFTLEGNFNNTIAFLNQFETKSYIGNILHFSTEKKVIHKDNSRKIVSKIIIERKGY